MRVLHALFASAAATASLLAQSAPCFDSNLGTNLGLTDDSVSFNRPLGFAFPGPGGNYTSVDISSNGFVWLGTNVNHGDGCCSGDAAGSSENVTSTEAGGSSLGAGAIPRAA